MRIWVTRTAPDAERTAGRLRALGHAPFVAPVLEVIAAGALPDLAGVAALAFTSKNGVAAFARLSAQRDLPAYAVGETTAGALRAAGFAQVLSADGDVAALVRLILAQPPAGLLLHIAPEEPAGDLSGALQHGGLSIRHVPLYRTEARAPLGAAAALGAEPPEVEAVLVHSVKGAQALAAMPAVVKAAPRLRAYCISEGAAAPLRPLGFAALAVAPAPNEAALLELLAA